ncbi:hypothetical protein [Aliivibrio fischeri]|uniref:hypothetical protein n=1 Tax=Aliivibrio fischeri TaxID=668 RepID=UPI0012DA6FC0|nr:hypothetical protein [Aliivibrio fischeri]MUJ22549.1 hypothetical protein [Aliivibrio fischeri]
MNSRAMQAMGMGFLLAVISALLPSFLSSIEVLITYVDSYNFELGSKNSAYPKVEFFSALAYVVLFSSTGYFGYNWESNAQNEIKKKELELDVKTQELIDSSAFMVDALQTLPPKNYLANFQETYIELRKIVEFIKYFSDVDYETEKELDDAIQNVEKLTGFMLSHFAKLTKDWDTQGTIFDDSVEYRINIMKFEKAETALKLFKNGDYNWKDSQRFFMTPNPEGIISDIDGVLFADKVLCAFRKNEGDQGIVAPTKPIALPVTYHNSEFYDQNLPGAPKAFSAAEAQYIICCKNEIHHEINDVAHISNFMRIELKTYYSHENFAQSIISFPLIDDSNEQYGVVNVYRNKSDLAKRNSHDFMALMRPIVETISEGVSKLYSLRDYEITDYEDEDECDLGLDFESFVEEENV